MPGSVVKAAPEQLRHRTNEEKEADRVVVRDIQRAAQVLRDRDVAAYTAQVKSVARQAILKYSDNVAVRQAVDQRPRPIRDFPAGDVVAVWRRSTGRGAPKFTAKCAAKCC